MNTVMTGTNQDKSGHDTEKARHQRSGGALVQFPYGAQETPKKRHSRAYILRSQFAMGEIVDRRRVR
jgi:hypothetical protein